MGAGTEAMLVGLGILAICGFYAVVGLSFELTPEQEKRKDYHWAWVKGHRWPGLVAKYVGVPIGALIFLIGVVASIIDRRRNCRSASVDARSTRMSRCPLIRRT